MGVLSAKPTTKAGFITAFGLIAAATQEGSVDQQDMAWMHEAINDLALWKDSFGDNQLVFKNSAGSITYLTVSANQIIARLSTGEITTITVGTSTIVGRTSTGEIAALTPAQVQTLIGSTVWTAKVNVSSAEILALNTTPKEIVAAPGANILIVPKRAIFRMNYGTSAYATNTELSLQLGTVEVVSNATVLPATANRVDVNSCQAAPNVSANTALNLTVNIGDPTGGDGTLDVWVEYQLIDIT